MLAPRVGVVAGGEVVEQLDVRHQAAAGVVALDEVVAEDAVVGKGMAGGGLEGVHLVDALAGEGAAAEQVLVNVGDRRGIGVDARRRRQDAGEQGARGGDEAEADARLQDAVAGDDTAQLGVEARAVERVGQGRHQPGRRLARQLRVGVQGDDETHPRQARQVAALHRIGRVRGPAQQAVELAQLAALALPAHPAALRGVPHPFAVEQEEAVGAARGVALVESADALEGFTQVCVVLGPVLRGGVGEVGQQREAQLRVGVGQVMDFQALGQGSAALGADEQGRHDDEGRAVRGDAVLEIELGQDARRQHQGEQVMHQADGQVGGRQQGGEAGQHQQERCGPGLVRGPGEDAGQEQQGGQ
jgi:hypothetical protein